MNYKRHRKHSKVKCPICAGQRRRFGWGNWKTREMMKGLNKELAVLKREI